MSDFAKAFQAVVGEEGGYSNDPKDPGGATKFGITEAVARANGYTGDMRDLSLEFAMQVYRKRYWNAISGDALPETWAVVVFDCAVNQGPGTAVKIMQTALGVIADGIIGPNTLARLSAASDWHLNRFLALRARRYMETANFDTYGTGWLTRLFSIAQKARA